MASVASKAVVIRGVSFAAVSLVILAVLATWPGLREVQSVVRQLPGRSSGEPPHRRLSLVADPDPRDGWDQNLTLGTSTAAVNTCPGSVSVGGLGVSSVVAATWNQPGKLAGPVTVQGGRIKPHMWGRAYLANSCSPASYDSVQYQGVKLLGKTLKYTTDVSQAGCGCNAAMYLVPMQKNTQPTSCNDYYCDANWVCGASCAEIDIQESNKYAWHTALHKEYDTSGVAAGYGGWVHNNNKYAFNSDKYGPGAACIDTSRPFQVAVSFPAHGGRLTSMDVTLSQGGCSVALSHNDYPADPGFVQISQALAEGVTPVFSYWKSADMLWMDGPGMGEGPCKSDSQQCGSAPQFYGFSVQG